MSILVVDVGTSGVRGAIVEPDGSVHHVHPVQVLPDTPFPGLVEFDPSAMADAVLDVAGRSLADGGPVEAVGIANQRASTIVWDRATGEAGGPRHRLAGSPHRGDLPRAPGQGVPAGTQCLGHQGGRHPRPVRSRPVPGRAGELAFGTVDSWVAWTLSDGQLHISDASNAGVTGLVHRDGTVWDTAVLDELRIPPSMLPTIVDSTGVVGEAVKLPGRPPIAGIAGDQQASLVGQGCTRPGLAKATFGTGGMLDQCVGAVRPSNPSRGDNGTIPIVAWRRGGEVTWGIEAIMLSAGTCVEWLRDDLGLIETAAESDSVAAACPDTGDVWFVPALLGLGTPVWDFGARGTYVGITRGTGRPQMVRAVLEGVAHRGCDLLLAAEADSGLPIDALRIDGGMWPMVSSPRPWPTPAGDPSRSRRCWRPPPWGLPSWPGWPSAPGRTRTTSPAPGLPAGWWSLPSPRRIMASGGSAGCGPGSDPEATIPELSGLDF